jgi:hypothetical protein
MLAGKLKTEYTPKARPLDDDPSFWETAREKGLGKSWLESDLYDVVRTHVENFIIKHDSTVWQILRQTVTWGKHAQFLRIFHSSHMATHLADGRQAVYDQIIDGLKNHALKPEIAFQLLHNTVDILGGVHKANLKLSPSIEICPLIAVLRHSDEKRYQETAQQFVEQFTDRK